MPGKRGSAGLREYLTHLQDSLEEVCKGTENGCTAMSDLLKDVKLRFGNLRKSMEADLLQFKSMKQSSCFSAMKGHLQELTETGMDNLYFIPLDQSLCFIESTKESLSKMNKTRVSIKTCCSDLNSTFKLIKTEEKNMIQDKEHELVEQTQKLTEIANHTRELCLEVVQACKDAISAIYTAVSIALSVLMNKFSVSIPNENFDFSSFETCNELIEKLDGAKLLEMFSRRFKPIQYFSLVQTQEYFDARLKAPLKLESGEVISEGTVVTVTEAGYSQSWIIDVDGEDQVVSCELLEIITYQ